MKIRILFIAITALLAFSGDTAPDPLGTLDLSNLRAVQIDAYKALVRVEAARAAESDAKLALEHAQAEQKAAQMLLDAKNAELDLMGKNLKETYKADGWKLTTDLKWEREKEHK